MGFGFVFLLVDWTGEWKMVHCWIDWNLFVYEMKFWVKKNNNNKRSNQTHIGWNKIWRVRHPLNVWLKTVHKMYYATGFIEHISNKSIIPFSRCCKCNDFLHLSPFLPLNIYYGPYIWFLDDGDFVVFHWMERNTIAVSNAFQTLFFQIIE